MFQKHIVIRKKKYSGKKIPGICDFLKIRNIPCFRHQIPEQMFRKLNSGMFHIPEWNSVF